MKLKHIIDEVSVDVIRTAEIRKLLKEYDALDGVLLESNDTRDVKIVVRLDELGFFDSITNEIGVRGGPKGAGNDVRRPSKPKPQLGGRRSTSEKPDLSQIQGLVKTPGAMGRLLGAGKEGTKKLGSMLASALKGGKTKLVAKIKTAINKVRGKAPNAPIKDVPGIPPEIAKAVDTPSPEASTDTTEPSAETPATDSSVTNEPSAETPATDSPTTDEPSTDATPAGDEAPTDTPSIEEPSADASPEETPAEAPAKTEPVVSPDTVSKLQRNAGITPAAPAPVDTPKDEPAKIAEPVATVDEPKVEPAVEPKTEPKVEPAVEPNPTPAATADKPKSLMPKAEPKVEPTATPDEPKRLIPKAEPKAAPDEPKRLIPKGEPTAKPTTPKFGTPEWTAARKQQLAAMSPEDKAKESEKALKRVGFTQTGTGGRGIGDRLGAAWKGLTAKAGEDLGKAGTRKPKYKSMFYEIAKKLHKMGALKNKFALHEWSKVFETAGYGPLGEYAQYLSENTMDEEKYTLRELYAMMEEMQQLEQAHNWWHKPSEAEEDGHIEPSKVHETAISLEEMNAIKKAFAAAAMGAALAGGAKDAGAQSAPQRTVQSFTMQRGADGNQVAVDAQGNPVKLQHTPADSVARQGSRDMQLAVNKAQGDLRSRGIDPNAVRDGRRVFKQDIEQGPNGTWIANIAPDKTQPPKTENSSFSLEEILDEMED